MKKFVMVFLAFMSVFLGTPSFSMTGVPNYYVACFTGDEFKEEWEDGFKPDF